MKGELGYLEIGGTDAARQHLYIPPRSAGRESRRRSVMAAILARSGEATHCSRPPS